MGMTNPRKKSGSGSDIMAEINIVPLCDIFLVLLDYLYGDQCGNGSIRRRD